MMLHFLKTLWFKKSTRAFLWQTLLLLVVGVLGFTLWQNLHTHLKAQQTALGFGFLQDTAGFSIITHLIDYSEHSSYGRAFLVGLLNTLLISSLAVVFATLLGMLIGVARLASYRIISSMASAYIEIIRNIPLLLQLFFWYFVVLRAAPLPAQSISFFNSIFITNRGVYLPTFSSTPHLIGLNFEGGVNLLPEFLALLIALSVYSASYIAEVIRLGILAVEKNQKEAAIALSLTPFQSLRWVIFPQALKVILPPLTNQYLNVIKNSSLAVAIAYPDLVGVFAGTVLNQSGHAVEIIVMTMAVYLLISLCISGGMLLYEKKTWQLKC